MPQKKIAIPDDIWNLVSTEYRNYGFQYPAQMVASLIVDGFSTEKYKDLKTDDFELYENIGRRARRVSGRKFSVAGAVKEYNKSIKGYDQALEMGWIDDKQYAELVKEAENDHKQVIELELAKGYDGVNGKKKSSKTKRKADIYYDDEDGINYNSFYEKWEPYVKRAHPNAENGSVTELIMKAWHEKTTPLKLARILKW